MCRLHEHMLSSCGALSSYRKHVIYSQAELMAVLAQDVFFSTELADSASGRWLGGPQVLLQGTLNGNISDVIVTLNA